MSIDASNPVAPFIAQALEILQTQTNAASALAEKVIHADNTAKILHEIRDERETADENILKFREFKAQICERLLAAESQIEDYIVKAGLIDTTPVDIEAATAEYKALVAQIKSMKDVVVSLAGNAEIALPPVPTPMPGVRKGASSASQGGTAVRRPRFSTIKVDGVDIFEMKGDKRVSTASVVAAHLTKELKVTVDGAKLREAIFAAAGTNDLASLNGKPIEFVFNVEVGEESKNLNIVAIPATGAGA